MTKLEIPAPAPGTRTRSPLSTRARVTNARQAVKPASGSAAASCQERRFGLGRTYSAGTAMSSAYVPCRGTPSGCQSGPGSSPSPQKRLGFMTTSSPRRCCETPAPTETITPAPSEPSTIGNCADAPSPLPLSRGLISPARRPRSRRLTDAARIETTTSPGPATGSGSCAGSSTDGSPNEFATMARIHRLSLGGRRYQVVATLTLRAQQRGGSALHR
jgi:hypothetical protein